MPQRADLPEEISQSFRTAGRGRAANRDSTRSGVLAVSIAQRWAVAAAGSLTVVVAGVFALLFLREPLATAAPADTSVTADFRTATGAAYHVIDHSGSAQARTRAETFAALAPHLDRAGRARVACESQLDACFEGLVAWRFDEIAKAFAATVQGSVYELTLSALDQTPTSDIPEGERTLALTLQDLRTPANLEAAKRRLNLSSLHGGRVAYAAMVARPFFPKLAHAMNSDEERLLRLERYSAGTARYFVDLTFDSAPTADRRLDIRVLPPFEPTAGYDRTADAPTQVLTGYGFLIAGQLEMITLPASRALPAVVGRELTPSASETSQLSAALVRLERQLLEANQILKP